MSREKRELKRHLRNADLQKWLQKNDAWFRTNPSALQSLLDDPEMLTALQSYMESRKNKINRRLARVERKSISVHGSREQVGVVSSPKKRKPLLRLPKLSLSNLNMETATERLSQAAEVMETIRNISGLLGR
ncbi:MAG TPA: hypothetical protein VJ824_03270 [Bacillota bacterium]|nr:hypothetical protein [Bacillota bacterium]